MARRNSISFDLRGDVELKRLLQTLPQKLIKKGMCRALNKAATPIVRDAKKLAPRDTGTLKKSIKRKLKTYPSGLTVCVIGPDRNVVGTKGDGDKAKAIRPANYAHLVEFGHAGPHAANAKPFLKPAYQANEQKAINTTKEILRETLIAEAKKGKVK